MDHMQSIRVARIGNASEKFTDTATRLNRAGTFRRAILASTVAKACAYESLTVDERDAVIEGFLLGDKLIDIADKVGITSSTVLRALRAKLVYTMVEAGLKTPAPGKERGFAALTK